MSKFIYYLPRALSILIVCFFALFILEGFGPDFGWQASAMHALLTLVVLIVTILAWKKPKIGCWIFIVFALWFLKVIVVIDWSSDQTANIAPLVLGALFLVIGILYLFEGYKKNK